MPMCLKPLSIFQQATISGQTQAQKRQADALPTEPRRLLSDRELNPGLQCDRLGYSPLYYPRVCSLQGSNL
ncbi:hypothetical protein BB561_000543 [Smittium simulii]|uniref:Uncharacterized protein n=1 Tax=Smittium simulii TaxID=133385 RepID=A0A2T9YYM0_9FUNG|nr:hypothetical protein BB561_000543 [Smittium simulii]